jgi:hypothetical protein
MSKEGIVDMILAKIIRIKNILANNGKVDVGACTVIAFRPGAENQDLLDVRMTAKHILQFPDNRIAESKPHSC